MATQEAPILAQLQRMLEPVRGKSARLDSTPVQRGLQPQFSFPNGKLAFGGIHEFLTQGNESIAATTGFISGILPALMQEQRAVVWISSGQLAYPPGLAQVLGNADRIVFLHIRQEKEKLWAMEEALKCAGIATVVAELHQLSFKNSRRLQLAVEKSGLMGFVIRNKPLTINTTACVTRWQVSPAAGMPVEALPGPGFPRWRVQLLKSRFEPPGEWLVEWNRKFTTIEQQPAIQKQKIWLRQTA